ncbi:hypothetical protein, conserved [Eimeria necatrix]|uniref:Uncharacterized protein n=1 Tax=Eimeria necatrix TaxID=51315 RepID=U6N0B6_9EIME|nr:hypothetical protein, conserved [Eimeria necatrix]CDJ68184.1 hypothetical protein, conserved [Eimeria necatrix]
MRTPWAAVAGAAARSRATGSLFGGSAGVLAVAAAAAATADTAAATAAAVAEEQKRPLLRSSLSSPLFLRTGIEAASQKGRWRRLAILCPLQQQQLEQQRQLVRTSTCFSHLACSYSCSSSSILGWPALCRLAASKPIANNANWAPEGLWEAAAGGSARKQRLLLLQPRQQQPGVLQALQQRCFLLLQQPRGTQQQLQQQRFISTKRRRYFKMRKFHKKKYKKRLLRSKKVPFVEINKPKRTWKTLHEMKLIRKEFRRGVPKKGARMLKLRRQR